MNKNILFTKNALSSNFLDTQSPVRWQAPPAGFLKLNSNATVSR